MAVRSRSASPTEIDLETTAELPAMDFSVAPVDESLSSTDIFQAPTAVPAGVTELADSLREVENRLLRKTERLAALEGDLVAARATGQELRAQLAREQLEARSREGTLNQDLTRTTQALDVIRADLAARETALGTARGEIEMQRSSLSRARAELAQRVTELSHQARDLQDLRHRSERHLEALRSNQGFRAVSEALIAERDDALRAVGGEHARELGEALARHSSLQAELAAARLEAGQRIAGLEESVQKSERAQQAQVEALRIAGEHNTALTTLLAERDSTLAATLADNKSAFATAVAQHESAMATALAERDSATAAVLAERDATISTQLTELTALRLVSDKAREGAAAFDEQLRQITQLQGDLATSQASAARFETDLRVAEERIARLESEAHANAALLGNLQQNIQRLGREDTGSRPLLTVVTPDTATRVLVRESDGIEVGHTLGRRTSIGRTQDNDIQIDETWISRHHAVVLCNSDSCVVEDLNSTNGVLVNGRRVGRQVLHDGDMVTIGKTEFRYHLRP